MKMKVVQQNLEKSDFIEAIVAEKIERVLEKFRQLPKTQLRLITGMLIYVCIYTHMYVYAHAYIYTLYVLCVSYT